MGEGFVQGHALVVGVGGDLPHTVGDAVGLADILKDSARCAYPPDQVHVLTGENATRQHILAALDALSQSTGAQSTLLVYFSGHGCQVSSPTGRFHYLMPYGYDLNDLCQTAISGAEFADRLRAIPAQKLLVLLDCCHAGGVGQAKAPGLELAKSPLPPEVQQLLAEGSGRVLVASSREDELSFAGEPYSAFTLALIEALCGTGVAKQDGYVRVADLALHAREVVPGRTGGRQHPILHFEQADNFVLATYAGGETQPKGVPLATELEIEPEPGAWAVALDQRGQTVHGPQTVIAGDVHGPVLSGTFEGPVAAAGGEAVDLRGVERVVYKPTIQQAALPEIPPPPEPTPPPEVRGFVGREAELAYFAEKLATSQLAVICGMAGVGKTALAAALARRFGDPRNIFWHSFHEGEGIEGLVWKLAGFLCWHGQEELWCMLQSARLTGGRPPPTGELLDYLAQMIRGQGYLLCFDDFQFLSDDDAARLGGFVRRLLVEETSWIVTSRRALALVPLTEFAPLAGLSAEDARDLLSQRGLSLPETLASDLHARIGGNAQFLTLAIDALRHAEDPARLIAQLGETDDIERYLLSEVDQGLTEQERAVMGGVSALLGYPGTRDAIEAVLDRGSVARTLIELCGRHLLTVTDGAAGREYGQHAIVQSFYYGLLGRRERRPMHRRAAEYYETEEPDVLKAARHYEQAGEAKRAAQLATADVWAIVNEGQAQALRLLLERFEAQQLDTVQWARISLARGEVYAFLGERDPARESYAEALSALDNLPDSDTVRELQARVCWGMGDLVRYQSPQEAMEWVHRGLDLLGDATSEEKAALLLKMSTLQVYSGDYEVALETVQQGLRLLPEEPGWLRLGAYMNLGMIYSNQGDIERARQAGLDALAIGQQLCDYFRLVSIWNNLGVYSTIAGDWNEAIASYKQALTLAERLGVTTCDAPQNLGYVYTRLGDYEVAEKYYLSSLDVAIRDSAGKYEVEARSNLAELYVRQGRLESARSMTVEAERLTRRLDARDKLPEICRGYAQISLAKRESQPAVDYASQSIRLARELRMPLEEGSSLRVLAQALLASDQPEPALEAFAQSLSRLEDKDPYEAARTRLEWGRALVSWTDDASGRDTTQGTALLQEARETFERLGAKRDLTAVDELLETEERGRP